MKGSRNYAAMPWKGFLCRPLTKKPAIQYDDEPCGKVPQKFVKVERSNLGASTYYLDSFTGVGPISAAQKATRTDLTEILYQFQ